MAVGMTREVSKAIHPIQKKLASRAARSEERTEEKRLGRLATQQLSGWIVRRLLLLILNLSENFPGEASVNLGCAGVAQHFPCFGGNPLCDGCRMLDMIRCQRWFRRRFRHVFCLSNKRKFVPHILVTILGRKGSVIYIKKRLIIINN